MTKKIMKGKELIFALIITLLLAGLDLTVLPASLFVNIKAADIEPIYFSLIINQWLLIIIGLVAIRYLCPNLVLGLRKSGSKADLRKYLLSALIFLVVAALAYYIGLLGHYDYTPTVWKVLVETFIYNISVGFIEELYIRGLLLNIFILLLAKNKNATFIAIIISSVLFSLGHIPGMIGLDIFTIVMRLIWTLMLGIYFGIMYKKTGSLWIPIITHTIINFSGIAFCFTTHRGFPQVSVIMITITSVLLGLWSIYNYFKQNNQNKLEPPFADN